MCAVVFFVHACSIWRLVDCAAMEPVSLMDRPVELRHDDDEEFADEASQEEYGSDEEHSQTDESDQSDHERQDQVI